MRPAARLGAKIGLVDVPSSRRTRACPVPTTGGIVIFSTIAGSLLLTQRYLMPMPPDIVSQLVALLIGGSVIVVLGVIDDRRGLKPLVKLGVQTVVAVAMVASGVAIEHIRFVAGPSLELGWWTYPVTVFWLVGFMNAVNLIDGLDGLAGGIAAIGAAALFAVGILNENPLLYLLAAAILGSSLGFLFHNFRKGNVYLGDGGSMALGFFLGGGALVGAYLDAASNAVLVAAACMAVPAFDVVTTILRRLRARRGMMTPDRAHVHHRLINFGLHPRVAVLVLWGVTVFFGGQALGFVAPHGLVYLLGSYLVAGLVVRTLLKQQRKNLVTTRRGPMDEIFYLLGTRGSVDRDGADEEKTLRQMIVAQIRRELAYRRATHGGRSGGSGSRPEVAATGSAAGIGGPAAATGSTAGIGGPAAATAATASANARGSGAVSESGSPSADGPPGDAAAGGIVADPAREEEEVTVAK
jgi:UDP-GlcNAc:undecaprenyl-phosphate GlcNAc-1-phosphate transferase